MAAAADKRDVDEALTAYLEARAVLRAAADQLGVYFTLESYGDWYYFMPRADGAYGAAAAFRASLDRLHAVVGTPNAVARLLSLSAGQE